MAKVNGLRIKSANSSYNELYTQKDAEGYEPAHWVSGLLNYIFIDSDDYNEDISDMIEKGYIKSVTLNLKAGQVTITAT